MPGDALKKFDQTRDWKLYEKQDKQLYESSQKIERTPWRKVCGPLITHGVHGHGLEPYRA